MSSSNLTKEQQQAKIMAESLILKAIIALQDAHVDIDVTAVNLSGSRHEGYANKIDAVSIECSVVESNS